MFRLLAVTAVLSLLASACSGASACGDLCSASIPCTGGQLTCVQSRCLVVSDAGPTSCPNP